MNPELAKQYWEQIKVWLGEGKLSREEADLYVKDNIPSFDRLDDLVYMATHGVRREDDPDQQRARVAEMSPLGMFARGAAQGASFGFADELLGMVNPELGERWSQDIETLREMAPGAMMMSEMAGGMALPGLGAGKGAAWLMGKGFGPAAARLAAGAGAGMLSGAATGIGEGEGLYGRTVGGIGGGAAGGLFGTALGVASGIGGRLAGRFFPSLAEASGGVEGAAGRMFRKGLDEGHVEARTAAELAEATARIGDDAVPADLSPSLGRQLYAARSLAPELDAPGGPMQQLLSRNAGRGRRIADDLDRAASNPQTAMRSFDTVDALKSRAQTEFYGPLDEAFGEMSPGDAPNIIGWFQNQRQGMTELFDNTTAGPMRFKQFQDFRNALRDEADVLRLEGRRTRAEFLDAQVDEFTAAMRADFGDEVAAADAIWSQALRSSKLYEEGLKLGSKSGLDLEIALRQMDWENMEPELKEHLLAGAIDRIRSKLTQRETGGGTATGMMRMGEDTEQQLRRLVGDNEEAMDMLREALDREVTYEQTLNLVGGNSMTAGRTEDIRNMRTDISAVPLTVLEGVRKFAHWAARNPDVDRRTAIQLGKALVGDEEIVQRILDRSQTSRWFSGTSTLNGAISAIAGRQAGVSLGGPQDVAPVPPPGPGGFFDGGF